MEKLHRLVHDVYVFLEGGDQLVLNQFDLTNVQFRLLMLLENGQEQSITELADRLLRNRSTATRLVSQLEKRHLVQRTDNPDDGRTHNVNLTPSGLALRQKAHEAYLLSFERRFSILSKEERATLIHLMSVLCDGLLADLDSHYQGGDQKINWK